MLMTTTIILMIALIAFAKQLISSKTKEVCDRQMRERLANSIENSLTKLDRVNAEAKNVGLSLTGICETLKSELVFIREQNAKEALPVDALKRSFEVNAKRIKHQQALVIGAKKSAKKSDMTSDCGSQLISV